MTIWVTAGRADVEDVCRIAQTHGLLMDRCLHFGDNVVACNHISLCGADDVTAFRTEIACRWTVGRCPNHGVLGLMDNIPYGAPG